MRGNIMKKTILILTALMAFLILYYLFIPKLENQGDLSVSPKDVESNIEAESTTEVIAPKQQNNYEEVTLLNLDNSAISNVTKFTYKDTNKELTVDVPDGDAQIVIGKENPNGIKLELVRGNDIKSIELPEARDILFDAYGDLLDTETYSIQVGSNDFNKDGVEEIIIAIGDNLIEGQFWIFSYQSVDDFRYYNPLKLELTGYYQEKIYIDGKKVIIPIGSQGQSDEYVWTNNGFDTVYPEIISDKQMLSVEEYLKEVEASKYLVNEGINSIVNILEDPNSSKEAKLVHLKMSAKVFKMFTDTYVTNDQVPEEFLEIHLNYSIAMDSFDNAADTLNILLESGDTSLIGEFMLQLNRGKEYWITFQKGIENISY